VSLTQESSVSFAFWFRASGLAKLIQQGGSDNRQEEEKQSDRDARVVAIKIFPGDLTLHLDDRLHLSAVAYDGKGVPVGGVRIKWTAQDEGRNASGRISPDGYFEAGIPGTFKVTAEGAGQIANAKIVVQDGPRLPRATDIPISVRQVSNRDGPQVIGNLRLDPAPKGSGAERAAAPQSAKPSAVPATANAARKAGTFAHARRTSPMTPAMPLPPYDGWNDSNYRSSSDPINRLGSPAGAPLDGGAGSGNFQFAVPILGLPGRGISISLGAAYNSRLWNKAGSQMTFDIDRGWPAPGFSLGFGKLLGMGVLNGAMLVDADGTRHNYTGTVTGYSWGTTFVGHTTDGSLIDYWYQSGTGGAIVSGQAKLANGTVIQYNAQGPGGVYPTSILDANGNYITITYVNNTGPQIQTVMDTLGRVVSFSYNANNLLTAITCPGFNNGPPRTLVRFHYRQLTLSYGFASPQVQTTVVREPSPWVVDAIYYPATATGYWFGDDGVSYSSYGMLAKVVEQRGMGFTASSLTDMGSVSQGQITRTETYNYPLTPNYSLTDAPTYTSMTESWTRDGTTNFDFNTTGYAVDNNASNPAQPTIPSRKVQITLPNQTQSIQYSYNYTSLADTDPRKALDGLVYQDQTLDGIGSVLQGSSSTWEKGAYDTPRPLRVEKTDERGQTTAAQFIYGALYNQVVEVRDYDYGGATLLRATHTQYQNSVNYTGQPNSSGYSGRHIFNLPLAVEVYQADNLTRASRTEYQYDGQTLTDAPGVVMHQDASNPYAPPTWVPGYWTSDCSVSPCRQVWVPGYYQAVYDPSTDYRGNVTQVTSYANAVIDPATIPITQTRRYDITGNLVTASTSCCQQTSFNYTGSTQYAYPLSKTRGSATDAYAQVTTSAMYDFNTGLTRSATDANERVSQTSYDPATLRPSSVVLPTAAHTEYGYDDLAMTVTSTTYLVAGVNGPIADQNVKLLNGMGQVRQEKALGAGSVWDLVDILYDNLGRVSQQSRPYRSGDTQQWTTAVYDALGRTKTVTAPDGSTAQTFYNEASRPDVASATPGETTRVQDAWGRERWGRTDASGRLVEVVEPNPNGNGSVATGGLVTTYAYNTLGNLITVTQGAQTRSFAYDSLGRLTAQKLAETSATLNSAGRYVGSGTWSDVFTYDDRSNLTSRTDARGVKTIYSYFIGGNPNNPDPLNRLQSISWDTTGFGDTGNPIFGAATVSYSYRTKARTSDLIDIGQLSSVTASGVSTESYGYDTEGRVSNQTATLSSRSSYPFVTDYTYDSLDRTTDVRYPAEYGNGSAPRKVVHHDYDIASRLTGLTFDGQSFASSIVYNAASQTTSLNVGSGANQIAENYSYNPQTGLLDNQTVARGATTLLNLSYDYAGTNGKRTGQLTKILNNLNHNKDRGYSYDALGRLTQATGGAAAAPLSTQTYSYDRYGNRMSVTASGYSAKNGSAGGSPALSAKSVPRAVATGSANAIAQPTDPKVDLPTDLLAKNNMVELPTSARDEGKPVSDSEPTLRAPSPPQSGPPTFTDPDLLASGGVQIKSLHITELRTAINNLRARLGLSAYTWTKPVATGGVVQSGGLITADPIIEMRTALDQALGAPSPAYAAGLALGQPILAIHIQELRNRIKSAWDAAGSSCPVGQTLLIDQFVKNFYQGALARQPNANELQSWSSQLRQAYYQGQTQLRAAAQYMGRQIFKSQEYANRGRDDHNYVYDLYWAYLQRQPDAGGWGFWTNDAAANGRDHTRVAFETDGTEFFPKLASLCPGVGSASPIPLDGLANLTYDTASNHITTAGFNYDAVGNQTRTVRTDGSAQRFQYDAANRLIQVRDDFGYTLEMFTYGDSNKRLIADEGGYRTYYACNASAEYVESSGSTTPQWSKTYVYLGNRLLSTLVPNGSGGEAVQFHHPDRLGTRLVTDPSNGTSFEQVTLPFGTSLNAESTGATNRRFTSYNRSNTTGLDYANNRHYDSQQGRFTQVDPAGMRATSLASPQSLNLYSYCSNDPINRTDPDGLGILSFIAKIYRAVKTILKWVAIVVAVAFVVVLAFAVLNLPGAQFLADVFFKGLGLLLKFMVHAGIMHFAEASGLTVGLTGQIVGAAMTVGAIANYLAQNRQKNKDQDKRPPKEHPLIIEPPKLPRGKTPTPEEAYNQCVATYQHIFNQDLETVTEEANKRLEKREKGPMSLGRVSKVLDGIGSILDLLSGEGGEFDPGDSGDSMSDLLLKQKRIEEIEKGTKEAAARRDERIQKNCKKP
jgi:RHS repeat-associated protein